MTYFNQPTPHTASIEPGLLGAFLFWSGTIFIFGDALLSLTTGETIATLTDDDPLQAQWWDVSRWIVVATFPIHFWLRWVEHWSLLPPPSTEVVEGQRVTLEGTVVGADETIGDPIFPERQCVAWCYQEASAHSAFIRHLARAKPFELKLTNGKIVHLTIVTPHWHTHWLGYRTDDIPERLLGPNSEASELFSTAVREYPASIVEQSNYYRHERSEYSGSGYARFARIRIGDTVTISGFLEKNTSRLETTHYRSIKETPSYLVLRSNELPKSHLPKPRSLAHLRGRSPSWSKDENPVLFFPATYREASGLGAPMGRIIQSGQAMILTGQIGLALILTAIPYIWMF